MAAPISYGVCLVVGLPAHFAMKRVGWTSIRAYTVVAAILGAPLVLLAVPSEFRVLDWITVLNLAIAGPAAAVVFWRIVRPDLPKGTPELASIGESSRV
jgi:hypothetical protein